MVIFFNKIYKPNNCIFRWFHQDNMCLDSMDGKEGGKPGLWKCHDIGKNQVNIIIVLFSYNFHLSSQQK